MPALPTWAADELLQRNSGNPNIVLATVRHPTFETLYLANNPQDIVGPGNITFMAAGFELGLINDDAKPPRAVFKFPNVDPILGRKISAVVEPVEVSLLVVSAAHPTEPLYAAPRLQMLDVVIAADFISGTLAGRDFSAEPLGTIVVTPAKFPALFRRRS